MLRAVVSFLEDVDALHPAVQARLTRFLAEGSAIAIGESVPYQVDVRLIASTQKDDLQEAVRAAAFRQNLLDALGALRIVLPPLRARLEDLPELVANLLAEESGLAHTRMLECSPIVLDALMKYDWPGNIPQLEHVIRHACRGTAFRRDKVIQLKDLPYLKEILEPRGLPGPLGRLAAKPSTTREIIASLCPKELDILNELAAGKSHREIADKFLVSVKTVVARSRRVRSKLRVESQTDLMRAVADSGWQLDD